MIDIQIMKSVILCLPLSFKIEFWYRWSLWKFSYSCCMYWSYTSF